VHARTPLVHALAPGRDGTANASGGFAALRAVVLLVGLVAALLAASLPGAARAHAAVPDRWGFAYLDNPAPPPGYAPDPSRQAGSWPSGSQATVDQLSLGSYVVHLPDIGGAGGIAHVTAVDSAGHWCQLSGWNPNGANEDVYVTCYLPNGNLDNAEFTVLYTASSGTPSTPVGSYGYLYSDVSGALLASYNSAGGTNSVSKGGTGVWKAWLPNLGLANEVGDIQVTAVDAKTGAHCKVAAWSPSSSGQSIEVTCFTVGGKPYDTRWTLTYSYQRAVYGPVYPPKYFGYLWELSGGVPAGTSYNSAGGVNAVSTSGTTYVVIMPKLANPPDHAQITAYGTTPDYCTLDSVWTRPSGTVQVPVDCFDPSGNPVKDSFFEAYASAF
jgi:hypothetical protein